MIVSTGVGRILDSEELDKRKVLDNLNVFNIAILSKDVIDDVLTDIVNTTDKKLSDKNKFIDLFMRSGLVGQLLLSSLW